MGKRTGFEDCPTEVIRADIQQDAQLAREYSDNADNVAEALRINEYRVEELIRRGELG